MRLSNPRGWILGCALAATTTAQQPQFHELLPRHLPSDRTTFGYFAVGDVDNDGDADLVTGNEGGTLSWLANQGDLRFEAIAIPASIESITAVAMFDLEGDGDLDLAVTGTPDGTFTGQILENDGTGSFTDITHFVASNFGTGSTHTILSTDLEGDGDTDLVLVGVKIRWLINSGLGTLQNGTATVFPNGIPDPVYGVFLEDLDLDGDDDLILTGDEVELRLNQGGSFGPPLPGNLPPLPSGTWFLPGDIDGDGDIDLIAGPTAPSQDAHRLENDGTGRFTLGPPISLSPTGSALVSLVDVAGDPLPDLISWARNGLLIHEQQPGGWFASSPTLVPTATSVVMSLILGGGLVTGDFDQDGDADVVTTPFGQRAHVLANESGSGLVDLSPAPSLPGLSRAGYANLWPGRNTLLEDLDGDGLADLVLLDGRANGVANQRLVYWGTRSGTFGTPRILPGTGGWPITATDLDGDQRLDLVVNGSEILIQTPGRSFTDQTLTWFGSTPASPISAVGDINGDGRPDIVGAQVHINTNGSRFSSTGGNQPSGTQTVQLLDIDNDGDLDTVWSFGFPGQWVWMPNDGTGVFGAAQTGSQGDPAWFADIDGDGDLDAFTGRSLFSSSPALWRNDGSGSFTDITAANFNYPMAPIGWATFVDVDVDGDPDLILDNENLIGPLVEWLENDGTGRFSPPANRSRVVPAGVAADVGAVGDVDHDGDPDLVVQVGNNLTIRHNLDRQLDVPFAPQIGGSIVVEAHWQDGTAIPGRLAAVWLDLGLGATAMPTPWGRWQLDATRAFPLGVIPINGSVGTVNYALPNAPAFTGVTIYLQAVMVDGAAPATWRTSNVVARRLIL